MAPSIDQRLLLQIAPTFYRSGEHSDVLVCYGTGADRRERPLHKVVLCSQSDFFKLMLSIPMKESHDNAIHLHEDVSLIDSALDFIYLGTLTYALSDHATPADAAVHLLGVYGLGNQYLMATLQDAAAARFEELLKHSPSLSANMAVLRAAYDEGGLSRDAHNLRRLIGRTYTIWARAMSPEMEAFLRGSKDAMTDYFFAMALERLEMGSTRLCWQCDYQVEVCVTPADPTVENRYATPVRNADFFKNCPACGNSLQMKHYGPVIED